MEVSPQELRDAASTIDGIADAVGKLATFAAPFTASGLLGSLGSGMAGSATAAQLDRIEAVRSKAMGVVEGRYQEIAGLLRTSADTYHGTDEDAAARFAALGDLNTGER
ncbi:type VII secretion target [Nocardia sp. CDC160]|uniref:type VII secretion target n=1 Tax=Nocardia sp. CDC160 TaxID=3112166 RepID=UPI002DC00668|nr:type VII secretion target [Nocardia sp. CDC160]MEC3914413.1 type VII secretion target [Nocardia sp. CDC160]